MYLTRYSYAIGSLVSTLIILCSCSKSTEQDIFVFDPTKDYPEFPLSLNDVAEVSYIKLGGEEDDIFISSLRGSGIYIDSRHKRIFASHPYLGVFEFDIQGSFLRRLGRLGRGPGEYMTVYFYVQPEQEKVGVYDAGKEKFLVFKYDGSFLPNEGLQVRLYPAFLSFLVQDNCLIDFNTISVLYDERDGMTTTTSENTLSVHSLNGQSHPTIKDIHFEKPLVLQRDFGEDNRYVMATGILLPSYSGIMMTTYRSDTTYVIEKDFSWRPFLVNERHNGVHEGCLFPAGETKDYLFLCHQNNLKDGQMFYFAIDKRTRQAYKITEDESSPLPGPLQGKIQIEDGGITKNTEYRFIEFQPEALKEECFDYLPPDLKALVDQCDEESNPILMLIKFKD